MARLQSRRLSLLLLCAIVTLVNALPESTTPSTPLNPFNSLVLCALFMLLASFVKSFSLLPYSMHTRVDRFVGLACGSIVLLFFAQRLSVAYAVGHVSLLTFSQYFMAGGICAFITHAMCTPIDVVKTRIQTTQGKYNGMVDCFRKIVADEGASTLLKGLGATASGYFLHGAFKYSFYEVFKVLLTADAIAAIKPPMGIAALAGFFAECIACCLLCPMEAIRIRSVADSSFPSSVSAGLSMLLKTEGLHGWYKGLPAMLLKQVPYTVGQFVSFEMAVVIVKRVISVAMDVEGSTAVAVISSAAGLLAGVMAAIISHPGDTILSKINQEEGEGGAWAQIVRVVRTAGFAGLFVGLFARVVQVSIMIGGQFLIYDSIKFWCGIKPASALPVEAFKTDGGAPVSAVGAVDMASER